MRRAEIAIRLGDVNEHAQLIELQRRASLANTSDRDVLLANPDAIDFPVNQIASKCVFVAEFDGVVVGFATVLPRSDGDSDLDALFVEPDRWRGGIGRRLTEHCCKIALFNGSKKLHVIGNRHASVFYSKCGFKQTGLAATRFGDGLQLELLITAEYDP